MMWKESYKIHLIKMDQFLRSYEPPLKNDVKVYLAGFLARYLDIEYKKQIRFFLLKSLEEMNQMIKKHEYKLGQKSIIYFYARINAEYKMFSLLLYRLLYNSNSYIFQLSEPANFFSIASIYSLKSGKTYDSLLFDYIYKRIKDIFSVLLSYSYFIELDKTLKELTKTLNAESNTNIEEIIEVTVSEVTQEELKNFLESFRVTAKNNITEQELIQYKMNQIISNFFTQS